MASTFPTTLDSFANPSDDSDMNDSGVLHSDQHADANDAIEAIEAIIGVTGSAVSSSVEYRLARKQSAVAFTGAPASASATGTAGTIVVAGGYLYFCTATDTWVRSAVAAW